MAKTEYEAACHQIRLMSIELMKLALERNWDAATRLLEDLTLHVKHVKHIEDRDRSREK